jgi:hypothetical protein
VWPLAPCRGTGEFVSRSRAGVDQLTEVKDFRSPSVTAVQSSGGQLWFAAAAPGFLWLNSMVLLAAAGPLSRRGRQGGGCRQGVGERRRLSSGVPAGEPPKLAHLAYPPLGRQPGLGCRDDQQLVTVTQGGLWGRHEALAAADDQGDVGTRRQT